MICWLRLILLSFGVQFLFPVDLYIHNTLFTLTEEQNIQFYAALIHSLWSAQMLTVTTLIENVGRYPIYEIFIVFVYEKLQEQKKYIYVAKVVNPCTNHIIFCLSIHKLNSKKGS